ncbi:microtubule-associated protein 9 isoform X6 [Manis pentadactyla]|uniref:microtubule-associated protein 9 isoform X6 n=1 Tax=Manis pentadactyla TaxID=143292 RepID=UPI00255CAC91|nr:microtubule-associated protein 9 isoform X6 [Manis pentadactyla]
MSDEVFSTTLAYTKSPKVTKRTTFQDELIKAITARSAKQRSSEYSDDFDSDEIVSLGDFSDTSVDENSAKKKMNDFHISDDEEKNSPKLSFLKTKRSKTNVMKDESVFSMKNEKELAPDGSEDVAVNPLSEPQNKDHEIETEKIKVKPKPRILPVKSTSSVENSSSLEADSHVKPSPRPRSMLRKRSLREETDGPGEDKKTAHCEESEAHCTPSSLPRLDGRQLAAEKQAFSENLGPEKTIEDRNLENKKSTNNRASSASGRLMTTEFLKKSTSVRRSPLTTTSSHYLGTLKVLDQKPSLKQKTEPDRADNIRAAVYQEWLEKKNVYLHEMHRIKRIESENLRIQNEQKRVAKREEALASFEAWKAMKEKEAKKIAAKKRLEDKNKKKTEEENAVRKGEALQAFERWKEKKMEYLKEKNKKEKEYERAKKQKEEEIVAEKRKDNLTAVEKWNERKEAFFKEKEKEKINEKRKEELKRAEKRDKDKQAIDEYEKWLEKKERQERIERKQKKHHSFLENETLPPWSPPSQTVFSKVFR